MADEIKALREIWRGGDGKPTAKALIERFDNLHGILDAPLEDLKQVKGIGDGRIQEERYAQR